LDPSPDASGVLHLKFEAVEARGKRRSEGPFRRRLILHVADGGRDAGDLQSGPASACGDKNRASGSTISLLSGRFK
jgi:hypothetical protein